MTTKCENHSCAIMNTLQLIGNKWVILIIARLFEGTRRFGELGREIPEISSKMLTQQLRKMEKDGLVSRKVYPEVPPKVEYSLTEKGKSLKPILLSVVEWGERYV
ncbi:MAG: helix-turn-helix transcriptional regulator [Desulfobacteraceae bacterium]|nr:helix-turn-helix transcriptional regulator [Desulfobacteraceae bacterium]